jgi:hypothetical protein
MISTDDLLLLAGVVEPLIVQIIYFPFYTKRDILGSSTLTKFVGVTVTGIPIKLTIRLKKILAQILKVAKTVAKPKIAKNCQKLPKIAKNCQNCQKLPKIAKIAKNGQKCPKMAKNGQKMAKNGQNC